MTIVDKAVTINHMNNENILYTVKWTQPYVSDYITINLRKANEELIENKLVLADEKFPEAVAVINRIRNKR